MEADRFEDFVAAVNQRLASEPGEEARVLAVRALLTKALADPEFVLSCLRRVTDLMEERPKSWPAAPVHANAELDYSVRMIYWPPRYANNPHQHRTWTVTGVFHNRLEVSIYRLDGARPVREKSFACGRSEVGYIFSPCVHSISNPTPAPSASLHIFSAYLANAAGLEGDEGKHTVWFPSPRPGEINKGATRRALTTHIEILRGIPGAESLALLDRAFDLGDLTVKLHSIKAMCEMNFKHAAQKLERVSAYYPEPARSELRAIGERVMRTQGK
jgi:predicted metal-dependent enzyme (double-stranded beta helix superfamily)